MKVAVLGYGTVGVGVYEMLADACGLEQGPVLVRVGKDDKPFKRTTIESIVNDPEVWAVAEVMGGIEPAFSYAKAAIVAGKHFVTSNKALVAEKGIELFQLAKKYNVAFLFSASCGGAIPFLHNLSIAQKSDEIIKLGGILNGTTNYMLDAMQRCGTDYDDVLREAQKLGYAEADPSADVSGLDALRKIMLACAVAYGKLPVEGLLNEGIENISAEDVKHFQSKGYTCRLMAAGGLVGDSVYAYVEPVLFGNGAAECCIQSNFNMAKYEGKNSGFITLIGQGAGRYPTASAVLRDLSSVLVGRRDMLPNGCCEVKADNSGAKHRYYIRCSEELLSALPVESFEQNEGVVRAVTKELSVETMHGIVITAREKGDKVFFAALA